MNNNIYAKHPVHYGSSLQNMNISPKYNPGWIENSKSLKSNEQYQLYPTKYASVANGRDYVALPLGTIITEQIKKKYNLC